MKFSSYAVAFCLAATLTGHLANAQTYIIVRHGEVEQNDSDDPRLSPQGLARVENLKEVIKGTVPDLVISSHLSRTHQTAVAFTGDAAAVEVVTLDYIKGAPLSATIAAYTEKLTKRLLDVREDKVVFVSTHGHVLPTLVKNLSGVDIAHTSCEYDHLVTVTKLGGKATVTHGRYGEKTPACK